MADTATLPFADLPTHLLKKMRRKRSMKLLAKLVTVFERDERTECRSDLEYMTDRIYLANEYLSSSLEDERRFAAHISFQMLHAMLHQPESDAAVTIEALMTTFWCWLEMKRRSGDPHGIACYAL